MLICSVSCKDETNHLLIIQAKWGPPGAERGHGLLPWGGRGEKALGDFLHLQYRGDQSVTLHYVSLRKMNQPRASHTDTRATVYCKQILFMKTDISQRQKTGAIKSVCQSLKSGFCKINLIVHFISYWNYYNQQKSLRNIQLKIKWNVIQRKWPTQTYKPWAFWPSQAL